MSRSKLWNRSFVIFLVGTIQSALGTALANVGLTFLLLKETGRADHVAINLGLSVVSGLLSPFAGAIVDRLPLKALLITTDVLRGMVGLGVWWMVQTGHFRLEFVYGATLGMSLLATFNLPGALKAVPSLVPSESLAQANAAISGATNGMNLLGMVVGGLLVQLVGATPTLLIDAATFLFMAGLTATVAIPAATSTGVGFWEDFRHGLALLANHPMLRMVPLLALVVNAAFAPIQVLVPYQMFQSGAGAQGYGTFMAVFFASIIVGNVVVAKFASLRGGVVWFVTLGLFLVAAGLGAMAIVHGAWIYALGACCGLGNALINTSIMTILQLEVPADAHGKVFGVMSGAAQLALPPAFLIVSLTLQQISANTVFVFSGAVIALSALVWLVNARQESTVKVRFN